MEIFTEPDIAQVQQLLQDSELPTGDLAGGHSAQFFACGSRAQLRAVVGIETYADVGLLRSLAVRSTARNAGVATTLVRHVEAYAAARGVRQLYLLTTTAEAFFARLGYHVLPRAAAPDAIRNTREFSALCPDDSAFMRKTVIHND